MPLYRIQAPNGKTYEIEGPEGASQQQVINAVLAQHPDAGQAPKDTTGIFERGARGLESLLASQRTALESVAGGDYAQKALERQQRISEKYPGQSDWEAVKGKYEKEGLLPAVGEYLSRIPGAVSEQLPQIGESMAGARLGSLAGPFGTVAGLVAPSYTQAYGTLLEREAEEQRKRGETVDPSRLQAAALAVPYSAIDTITTLIPMGKGIVKSLFGEEVSKLLFKGATKEAEAAAAKKLAEEGLPKTLGKGLFKGAAFEIPGEVSQQVIERFQAGLPLLDDDALKEYGETAFSTSMLAPLGAAGRLSERSGARNLIEQQRQEEDAKQRLAQAKAEEERRNSPEYIKEFVSAYEDAQEQFSAMKATVKKPGNDALPADHAQYHQDKAAMDELGKSLYAGSSEYKRVKPLHDKLVEDERYNAMTPEERLMESLGIKQAAPAETEAEEQQAPQYTVDEMGRVVEVGKQKEAPQLSPEQAYAEKQLQQATDFGQLMLDDKVSWLMQNPAMAKLLVDNNVQIPGVSPQENKTILSVLRLQLKDAEKQRKVAATERGETETEQLQAQLPGMEEAPSTAFDELVSFAQESKEQASEELRHLDDTFVAGLSRPDTGALTVSMNPVGGSAKKPAQIRDRVDAAFQEADKADEEYFSARAARQPDAALAAKKRATDAVQKLNALAETGSDYAKELVKLRRAQIAAWGRLTAAMDDLRADHTLDSQDPEKRKLAASTRGTLQKQIARARADLITSILQEAATNRRASWQQLSKEEAIQGADRIRSLIDSWTERAATTPQRAEYEDVEIPAQMRADKIVQPARIERRLVSAPVSGLSNRENLHFINSIRGATKDILAVPTSKVTKETPELKQQFASVEKKRVEEERGETKAGKPGELTRLREYVGNKLTKALGKTNLDDDLRSDLEAAQDIIEDGKASRNLLDIVDHIAERINTGRTEGLKTKFEKDPTKPGRVREVQYIGETAQNVQELKDALRLSRGVAEDTSGQRQLDLLVEEPGQRPRLVEKDLGYIRMTPENFANSPKVKAARDAVDKLRVLLKRTDAKKKREQEQKQKLQAASAQLQDAKEMVTNIKANTRFFQAGDEKFANEMIAKLAVPYPEPLPANASKEEKADYNAAVKEHKETVKQYIALLAQGQRIEDANNAIVALMQNKNEAIKNDAAKLQKELQPLLDFIKRLESELKAKAKLTPAEKRVSALLTRLGNARAKYEALFNKVYHDHMLAVDKALAELLDPSIKNAEAALSKAEENLDAEKAELERLKTRLETLTKSAKSKTDIHWALYEQFQYEEKQDVVTALEKDIKALRKELEELYEDRSTDFEMAAAGAKAALDKHVQAQRDRVIAIEKQIAELRGEDITEVRRGVPQYPFSLQQKENELKAAKAELKQTQNKQIKTEERIKTAQEQMEESWKTTYGGTGRRRTVSNSKHDAIVRLEKDIEEARKTIEELRKKAESRKDKTLGKRDQAVFDKAEKTIDDANKERFRLLSITEEISPQNELDKKREAEQAARDRAYDAQVEKEVADLQKAQRLQEIDNAIADNLVELEAFDDLPDGETELRKLVNDEDTSTVDRNRAIAKATIINQLTSLDQQRDALQEGKPARPPKAATTESTVAQAARTVFRTGYDFEDMLKDESAATQAAAKAALGRKAPKVTTRLVRLSNDLRAGIIQDDFDFSRGVPAKGTAHSIKSLIAELEKSLGQRLFKRGNEMMVTEKLDIYENPEQFMQAMPEYAGLIPSDAKGFVHKGKAVLFANNIGKGHGLGVLLHEVGVHIGFKNFFNTAQYNRLVKTVKMWSERNDGSVEAAVGKAAMERVKAAGTPVNQVNDELLAYAVEEAMRMGVNPAGVKGGSAIANWLKLIVDAFKKALVTFGVNPKNLTAGDLVNMAYGAAHLELNGTWHGSGAFFTAFDHAYMSTGEGRQAFGWGNYRAQSYGTGQSYMLNELRKNIKKWSERPEIIDWQKSQLVKVGGLSYHDVEDILMERRKNDTQFTKQELQWLGKILPKQQLEMYESPYENLSSGIKDVKEFGRRGLPGKTFARPIRAVPAGVKPPPVRKSAEEIKRDDFYNQVLFGKYNISAPVPLGQVGSYGYYKGRSTSELLGTEPDALWRAVSEFNTQFGLLETPLSETTFNTAKEKTVENLKYLVDVIGMPEYKDSIRMANGFEFKDFSFEKATKPPIPRPVGIMHRMLSVAPEEHYLLWDKPWKDQSKYVKDAYERLVNGIPKKSKADLTAYINRLSRPIGKDYYDAVSVTLEEAGIPSDMADMLASQSLASEGIVGHKFYDGATRHKGKDVFNFNYVDYLDEDAGPQVIATNVMPVSQTERHKEKDAKQLLFSRSPTYATDEMARLGTLVDKLVAPQKSANEKLRAATGGFLGLETQLVDRFAPLERLSKVMDDLKGSQMMYYLRTYDQRMNLVAQVVAHGAPEIVEIKRKDGRVERVVEAKDGANIKNVVETLKAAKPYVGNAEAVNRLFTMYLSAIRAKNKGFHTLHLGEEVTEEELAQAFKEIRANEKLGNIFESARAQYNEYNRDQIKFLVQSGFLSEAEGKRLIQNDDYIPFYRERNGVAEMLIGGETPIRIGSIKEMPYLQPLLGDNKRIFDFFTTSVQNTNMIVEMGLHNISTKNAVYSLADIGAAEIVKKAIGNDIVKFKENGEERYARIDGLDGIPGGLIVKGMEGIPTQLPFVVKLMGIPARFLRKAITISPLYQAKQLFRDSTAAAIMSGADFMPVIGAARQIGKNSDTKRKLERRGITGGQQFTGTTEDISMILREIADGKTPLVKGLAMMEALGREADASTRRAQYNSYIEQGLSEMEATLMALESMNFSKRGASPSIHWANSLIPFVNAQIQGLNVLYKSFTGKMPFNERLKIQQKLLQRGALLATASLMYAAAMQDDEAYENATPDQKYGNFFVRIPGLDEPLRVPVPFELGYIFKAIPEAIYNTLKKDEGGKEAFDAFKQILLQTIPGGTSLGVPQAIKPALETYLGKSFYTQRDILSRREQEMLPEEQFRPNTTGFAKAMSSLFGVSPIKVDYLVNGYFGGMGLAALQAVSVPFSTGPEQATRRWSETPVVGGAFQPNDAGGIINQVYEQMQEAQKVRNTVNNMVKEGRVREAQVLVNEHANEFMLAQTADWFTKQMSQLSEYERAIKAMSATPDQKREMLDNIRQMKIQLAKTVRDVAKTTRQ